MTPGTLESKKVHCFCSVNSNGYETGAFGGAAGTCRGVKE
jgi:hypothetical protein